MAADVELTKIQSTVNACSQLSKALRHDEQGDAAPHLAGAPIDAAASVLNAQHLDAAAHGVSISPG